MAARPSPRLPSVWAVVLTWNGLQDTLECVASLRQSDYANLAIVVADNGSREEEVRGLRERLAGACAIVENGENLGYARGLNAGIRRALAEGAEYVLALNNDTVVGSGTVSRLVEEAEKDSRVGLLSPRIYYYDRPDASYYPMQAEQWAPWAQFHLAATGIFNAWKVPGTVGVRRVRSVDGAGFLARRSLLEAVGLFDPVFPFGSYEVPSLCARVAEAGFRALAVLDVGIWHKVGRSFTTREGYDLGYAYRVPRNRVLFARRRLGLVRYLLFLAGLPLDIASLVTPGLLRGRGLRTLRPVLRGLRDGFSWERVGWSSGRDGAGKRDTQRR